MKWKVTYQSVPFNYTSPAILLIEAESKAEAFITAYDHLTTRGFAVSTQAPEGTTAGEVDAITKAFGVQSGDCRIRIIEPYTVVVSGRVLAS